MGELSGNDMPKGKGEGRITAQNVTNFKVNLCLSEAGSVVFSVSPSVEIPPIYEQPIPLVEYSGEFLCPDGISLAAYSHIYCSFAIRFQAWNSLLCNSL